MEVDLNGMKTYADFEVSEILDDKNPYHALLGIDLTFDNDGILNLKQSHMSFEKQLNNVV
jgi:hypothetical protein